MGCGEMGGCGDGVIAEPRRTALDAFNAYASAYDTSDERIALKIEHTHEVACLCDQIARAEGWPSDDVDLAWLCGLLHDIGRFEQLRRWGTFNDAASCSHAELGLQVLDDQMRFFGVNGEWAHIIRRAVAFHSDLRLPVDLSERERRFCVITRDADKIDILRVFSQSSCEAVLGITPAAFAMGEISGVAMRGFGERRCLARDERPGSLDGLIGALCLVFELELPSSHEALHWCGYVRRLLKEPFGREPIFTLSDTRDRWAQICSAMSSF